MHIVFAVLLFISCFLGCSNSQYYSNDSFTLCSSYKNSAVYTAPGDFDGNGSMENLYISKIGESYYICIPYDDITFYKKLNYQIQDLKLAVQDINGDQREDIILNVIQNNCENCYVYTLRNEIIDMFSSYMIKNKLDLQKIKDYIALECAVDNMSNIYDNPLLDINLYYTEMDYIGDELILVSEGSICDKDVNILDIQTAVSINRDGNIIVKSMNLFHAN